MMPSLTPLEWILALILLSTLTGIIGKYMGSENKVPAKLCEERRINCSKMLDARLQRIEEDIKKIFEILNNRFVLRDSDK